MSGVTRRQFGATAGKTAAAALLASAASTRRVLGANDRVRLGFIGLGNRGDQVLDAFLAHKDAEVVAICDIYQPYLDFAAKKIGGQPAAVQRLPQAARAQGRRRRRDHHAGPLARAADDPRLRGGQGRLRREAAVAVRRRGAGDGRGGAAAQARRAGRHSAAIVARSCKEAAELVRGGGDRQGDGGAGVPHPERVAEGHRQPARRGAAGRTSTGTPGSGPAPQARLQQEPHLLPLPLVLRLLRRAAHQLRRPLPRRRSTGRSGTMRRWR